MSKTMHKHLGSRSESSSFMSQVALILVDPSSKVVARMTSYVDHI